MSICFDSIVGIVLAPLAVFQPLENLVVEEAQRLIKDIYDELEIPKDLERRMIDKWIDERGTAPPGSPPRLAKTHAGSATCWGFLAVEIRSIGDEATDPDVAAERVHRGQFVP